MMKPGHESPSTIFKIFTYRPHNVRSDAVIYVSFHFLKSGFKNGERFPYIVR